MTVNLFINGLTSSYDYTDRIDTLEVYDKLNQPIEFHITFNDADTTSAANIKYAAPVYLKFDSVYPFGKLKITGLGDESNTYGGADGYGWSEASLNERKVAVTASADSTSQSGRPIYNNVAVNTIVSEQLTYANVGVSPYTSGQSTRVISTRSDNDYTISFMFGCATTADTDCFGAYSVDFATNYISIGTRGTDKSATVSLDISGATQNCEQSSRLADYDSLKNVINLRGYGDGINQIESYADHCTSFRTYLTSEIDATDTTSDTFTVNNGTGFPTASHTIWVGCEKLTVTRSGNTFTIVSRGTAYRGNVLVKPYTHKVYSPVVDAQYTTSSPQSTGNGSSINTNGIKEYSDNAKTVIDQSTLDILAEKILIERKGIFDGSHTYTAPERIVVTAIEPSTIVQSCMTGDWVTVTDSDTSLSGSYRIYGMRYTYSSGEESLEIELSNASLTLLQELADNSKQTISLASYMQGATNCYMTGETDNCDSTHGIVVDFYIPTEAVAVNKVKFNYRIQSYREFSTTTSAGSIHSHGIPSLALNTVSSQANTSSSTTDTDVLTLNHTDIGTGGGFTALASSTYSLGSTDIFGTYVEIMLFKYDYDLSDTIVKVRVTDTTSGTSYPGSNGLTSSVFRSNHTHSGATTSSDGAHTHTAASSSYYIHFSTDSSGTPDYWSNSLTTTSNGAHTHTATSGSVATIELAVPTTISIFVPGNLKNHSLRVEAAYVSGGTVTDFGHFITYHTVSTHTHEVSGATTATNTTNTESAHTHGVTYGIAEPGITANAISSIKVDGGSDIKAALGISTIPPYDVNDKDILAYLSSPIAGAWHTLEIIPNGNCRIMTDMFIQMFLQSK